MDEVAVAQKFVGALGWLDYSMLGIVVIVLVMIAYFTGKEEKDTHDFFLGGRKVPTIVACFSFVATEVSAVTIIGVPATGFRENWQYLQYFIGSATARVLIAFLFIPVFYKYNCTTIYEFLKHRFGKDTQYTGSIFFFITRLLASGVRLYAACLGVSVIMGWSLTQAIIFFTIISILFIAFGGIKAVVWTGAFETTMFYLVGIVVIGFLLYQIRGGLAEAWRMAGEAGRLSLFNFKLNLADPNTIWAATLNGLFVGLAAFGTDQELMQRLLTVDTRKSSQKAILYTILTSLPVTCIYLAIGTLLFIFYKQRPELPLPENTDKILSHFVLNTLPMGFKGLVLSAIILASIDSPLSSLSTSFVTDIYKPLIKKDASEHHYLWVSRIGIICFGVILAVLAYMCRSFEGILWVAFKVLAVTGGSLLGVFLLGILTKQPANKANIVAMITNSIAMAVLLILSERKIIALGWSWLIVIGTVTTFVLGYLLGPVIDKNLSAVEEVKNA